MCLIVTSQTLFGSFACSVNLDSHELFCKLLTDEYHTVWSVAINVALSLPAGFSSSTLATLLYDMGPQCPSCNPQALQELMRRYQFDSTLHPSDNMAIISKPLLTDTEVAQLSEVHSYIIQHFSRVIAVVHSHFICSFV